MTNNWYFNLNQKHTKLGINTIKEVKWWYPKMWCLRSFHRLSLAKWLTSHWTFVLQTGWVAAHHDHPNHIICTRVSSVMHTKGQCVGGKMSSFRIAKSPTTAFLQISVNLPRFLTWNKYSFGHRFQTTYTCFCIKLKRRKWFSGVVETSGLAGN